VHTHTKLTVDSLHKSGYCSVIYISVLSYNSPTHKHAAAVWHPYFPMIFRRKHRD